MSTFNINNTLLGKQADTPEHYDSGLLFRIPRSENREHYALYDDALPFVGSDVWNCYEVSFLTDNGLPVSRMMKLIYSCDSPYLVESKSLKLYLNSFNMDSFGATVADAISNVVERIRHDVGTLLETEVRVMLFTSEVPEKTPFPEMSGRNLTDLIPASVLQNYTFTHFNESPDLLKATGCSDDVKNYMFKTDLLRSNCRVTNQPDWGDLFVSISTTSEIDLLSVVAYLVSFRKENHFHEEVVEMIYKRFMDVFEPEKLMVAAMYTRRGGIDINPIRASHAELLDEAFLSSQFRLAKTLRQ